MSYHPVNRHQGQPLQRPGEIKHPSQAINQAAALPDYFELPSKKSSAVTIKAPSAKATAAQSEAYAPGTKSDAAAISRLAPIVAQPSPTTTIKTSVQKQLQEKPQSTRDGSSILTKTQTLVQPPLVGMPSGDESSAENVYPEPAKQVSKGSSAISAKDSSLNIYASIHVPDWLNAINESVAVSRPCQPLPRFNAQQYAILTGATIHVDAPVTAPPPASSAEALLAPSEVLSNENYFLYFSTRLNAEFVAFDKQLGNYSLYNHAFPLNNINQMLHEVRVPGLREFSPPVDLGDVVLVRPINPFPSGAAIMQNKRWRLDMQHHGTPHPLFNGIEYHAVVWRVSYTAEILLLRVDRNGGISPNANFRFVVQAHKTQPLLRAINNTALAVSSAETLRSMLFPRKEDGRMQVELLRGSFDLEWKDDALNFEQQKAVANVVAENYGAVPYLISGPPGTGKTKTIVEIALQLLCKKKIDVQPHLLICAPSDAAADTLALRLSKHLNKDQLFRLNGWARTFAEVPDALMLYSFVADSMFSVPPFHTLMSFDVVVTTCRDANLLVEARLTNKDLAQLTFRSLRAVCPTAVGNMSIPPLHWTALLLDEAAQATEPEALIPLSVVYPLWQPPNCSVVHPQFILAGDEFQLGPRLASAAQKTGLEVSLFQRLFTLPFYADHPLSRAKGMQPLTRKLLPLPRPAFTNLIRNYRSNPGILTVPSSLFYHDTLVPEYQPLSTKVAAWPRWCQPSFPVLFVQNIGQDHVDDILVGDGTGVGSLHNPGEAAIVLAHTQALLNEIPDLKYHEVMVMSPFRAQVGRIRTTLRKAKLAAVNVGPLEAFQGLESRIVILCTTRTRRGVVGNEGRFIKMDQERGLGVIDEPKRFNVAITRAMEGLIVVGDARTLTCTGDKCWQAFLAFCARNDLIQGDIGDLATSWTTDEGRLERGLRLAASGVEEMGVMGLRGFVEDGEEEGEMTLPEEVESDEGSVEEMLGDEYGTLRGLNLDGAVI